MRRIPVLAWSVWLATLASIGLFTLFWRIGYFRPHLLWGLLSLAAIFIPLIWLAGSVLWRVIRGPCRLRAVGWLLVGVTALVWVAGYLGLLIVDQYANPRTVRISVPVRVAAVWASWLLDFEARWHYPRWTRGQHVVLIDDSQTPSPEKLVAQMDEHIQAMADLLGQPVPSQESAWVRGGLFPFTTLGGRSVGPWAFANADRNSAELGYVDRHELAHSLIIVLSGPDQDPPKLLVEGWAQSQSDDRDRQIQSLAKERKQGLTYSLRELVGPDRYDSSYTPAYTHGGPLVHYLIEHYGPKTFFRLYSGVRRGTFHEDCRAILGDSWETVEKNFWRWIDAETESLARARAKKPGKTPAARVELAKSVDPADWQALVEGYREANKNPDPLPTNAAFVLEGETVERQIKAPGTIKRTKREFRAVFEGKQFWIFHNVRHPGGEFFLMATPACNVFLVLNKSGEVLVHTRGEASLGEAWRVLEFYREIADPAVHTLPLGEVPHEETRYRIERLARPADGKTGRWSVEFTTRDAENTPAAHYQVELDPAERWWMTRAVYDENDDSHGERDMESQWVGDAFLPVAMRAHYTGRGPEVNTKFRLRPLSQAERQELKQRVERAAQSAPAGPYQWLRRLLLAVIIACPLGGATLLGITRRRMDTACPRESGHGAQ